MLKKEPGVAFIYKDCTYRRYSRQKNDNRRLISISKILSRDSIDKW
jgi:hypothetical protein